MADSLEDLVTAPKKRGRPPGSRNRRVSLIGPPNAKRPKSDYDHADPETLVSRQLALVETAQIWLRDEMAAVSKGDEPAFDFDLRKLHELSQALCRTIESLKRASDCAEEMAKRLSPEQLLEAALKKLEAQDAATIEYAIKRLRQVVRDSAEPTKDERPATDAIKDLL